METKRLLIAFTLILFACAPALDRSYLREGEREASFEALRRNPDRYKGTLYVLGGVIVETKLTERGSQIEALHVPVDRYGHFKEEGRSEGRFLAITPSEEGMTDPEVYRRGRRVTLAGEFIEVRKARIDGMDYVYPVFRIRQIHLWPRERRYYPAYYYDPWFYPYSYYYWDPWWRFPYYNYYNYRYRGGPIYRRTPPPNQPPPSQAPPPQRRERPGEREGRPRA